MELRHASPRKLDDNLGEFWLENPFDFQRLKGFNLSMFERNRLFFNQGDCVFADVSHISATDIDADLMVMGAYGHSRFREAIFGGATRSMLEDARLPVLMAH